MLSSLAATECSRNNVISTPPSLASPPKKRSKLFSFMPQQGSTVTETLNESSALAKIEVTKFLSYPCVAEDSDPLAFWKGHENSYPTLAKLARRHLAIQASSAAVERIFSIAGKVFRPDRCSMTDLNFETVMFIKCNDHTY